MIVFQDFNHQRELFHGVDNGLKTSCHCVEFQSSLFEWWFFIVLNVPEQKVRNIFQKQDSST